MNSSIWRKTPAGLLSFLDDFRCWTPANSSWKWYLHWHRLTNRSIFSFSPSNLVLFERSTNDLLLSYIHREENLSWKMISISWSNKSIDDDDVIEQRIKYSFSRKSYPWKLTWLQMHAKIEKKISLHLHIRKYQSIESKTRLT